MLISEKKIRSTDALYQNSAAEAGLYTHDEAEFQLENVSKTEMIKAYDDRLAHKKGPGRPIYEKIRLSSEICPLCNEGVVAALDHYLPKTKYHALAVNPNNLVPICSDCNTVKKNYVPTHAANQALHPYYDRIDDVPWLSAKVVESGAGAALFEVDPPSNWNEVLAARVKWHFKQLNLAKLYATKAAAELASLHYELAQLLRRAGEFEVRASLRERAEARTKISLNSWQSAMYAALSDCEWYYSGGFLNV